MRAITEIIVHCSDTYGTMDIGAKEIRHWHTAPPPEGRGWRDIGYHYVIRRDGTMEPGRPLEQQGAHVAGHNENSIGICLVGGKPEANFTEAQMGSLRILIQELLKRFGHLDVLGHRDFDHKKQCPMFDVHGWWVGNVKPPVDSVS